MHYDRSDTKIRMDRKIQITQTRICANTCVGSLVFCVHIFHRGHVSLFIRNRSLKIVDSGRFIVFFEGDLSVFFLFFCTLMYIIIRGSAMWLNKNFILTCFDQRFSTFIHSCTPRYLTTLLHVRLSKNCFFHDKFTHGYV